MKNRYRLFNRKGVFYSQDCVNGKQQSLETATKAEALELLRAKNSALQQPILNLELAKAYLAAADPRLAERTWAEVMKEFATHGRESTQERSLRMAESPTLNAIRNRRLIETTAEELLDTLRRGGAATNNYMRRYHNLACKLGWLPRPILYPAVWPKVTPKRRRAITHDEYERIIATEGNVERRAYYQLLWETGAAQTDGALIRAEDIDWEKGHLIYQRKKLREDAPSCALALNHALSELLQWAAKLIFQMGPRFFKICFIKSSFAMTSKSNR